MGYARVHTFQPRHDHHPREPQAAHHGLTDGTIDGSTDSAVDSAVDEVGGASRRACAAPSAGRARGASSVAQHPGATLIEVQSDVSPGLVGTTIVGRPNQTICETADRVRIAIYSSAFDWPSTRRITILLSPADLPKSGAYYDLPMALAVLAATGQVDPAALEGTVFAGELGLDGALRPTGGIEAITCAAAAAGFSRVVVPKAGATDLAEVPGLQVIALPSLAGVVALLREENSLDHWSIGTIRDS